MYALNINNNTLDLPTGAGMSLVLSCPIFDLDRVVRTFSYPLQLPLTDRNVNTLRHANRFDAQPRWGDVCTLVVEGAEYERGELYSTGDSTDAIEVAFRSLPIAVLEVLKRTYINEILETITLTPNATPAQITLLLNPMTTDRAVVLGGTEYQADGADTTAAATHVAGLINADYPGIATPSAGTVTISSENINLIGADWSLLVGISFSSYFTIGQKAFLTYTDHVEAVVATPVDTHCFPLIHWENFYEGKNAKYLNIVNPVLDGTALPNDFSDIKTDFKYTHLPCARVPYIIDKICEAVGIPYWSGYLKDDTDANKLFVLNDRSADKEYYDFTADNKYQYINGYEAEINLNKHVPKMTAWDFLISIANGMNLIVEYRDGGLHLTKALDRVADAPVDYSKYVDVRRYSRTVKKAEGMRLIYAPDEAEAYADAAQLTMYEIAPSTVRSEMPFRTMFLDTATFGAYGDLRCLHTSRVGRSPAAGKDTTAMPLYLAFDRGIGETSEGNEYPYATYDHLGSDGTTEVGALSLDLQGDFGLVAQNFGTMLAYPDYDDMDVSAVLPVGEFYRLRLWQNARIRFYHPNGAVTLILKSVDGTVSARDDSGYIPVRFKGIIQK